jgi:hypothetical protein
VAYSELRHKLYFSFGPNQTVNLRPEPPTFEAVIECHPETPCHPILYYTVPTGVIFTAVYSGTFEAYVLDASHNTLEPIQIYPGHPTQVVVYIDSTALPAGASFLRLAVNAVDAVGRTSSGELAAALSPYSPPVPPTFESTLACTTAPPIPYYTVPTPVFFDAMYSGTYEGYVQDIWTAYILDVFRNILEPVYRYTPRIPRG